ncbi:MAG TPA: shikimate kinase [Gemmatimonadaceae bacterium]|nr:shikimate kinase [Gemmatimonadaceae bacterium]
MPTFRTSNPVSAADIAHATGESRPHLVLVGLPGSGKTRSGLAAAEQLGRRFLDFDTEIERREHQTVAEIFAAKGEPHFRSLEVALTRELSTTGNMVLSPGGGWIANSDCLKLLRPPATLVYLQVKPEIALSRIGGGAWRRPLLNRPNPLAELRRLLVEREPMYLQADHTISTDLMSFAEVVSSIVALARA